MAQLKMRYSRFDLASLWCLRGAGEEEREGAKERERERDSV
jgi:hypothetical protein